jgi:hypothetical protein
VQAAFYGDDTGCPKQLETQDGQPRIIGQRLVGPLGDCDRRKPSGKDRGWLQIEDKEIVFDFEIESLKIVGKLLRFLEPGHRTGSKDRSPQE